MNPEEKLALESIQLELLFEGINRRYGYDFQNYARASLKRRLREYLENELDGGFYFLLENVLKDRTAFEALLSKITVNVTSMFRDPEFYIRFRSEVVPILKTYPSLKIWHAGCSTGEEVYSMAILLKEAGLYDRAKIFATDIDVQALERAKEGIYHLDRMKKYTQNFNAFNGQQHFTEYYTARYDAVMIHSALKENITFYEHNLVSDGIFSEFNLILCRNVMIYFDKTLQERVLDLFTQSLPYYGILCLGMKESLLGTAVEDQYVPLDRKAKIYRKQVR